MLVSEFGGGRLVLGLVLGLALGVFGTSAVAQQAYVGDQMCSVCHSAGSNAQYNTYPDYFQHGHRWQEIATGGQAPGPDNFGFASVKDENGNPIGLPTLPTITVPGESSPRQLTWADVKSLVGNFKEGQGSPVIQGAELVNGQPDGNQIGYYVEGTRLIAYPANCFFCHNPTGYTPTPTAMYGIPNWNCGAPAADPNGKWLTGVQCEHCHGPGGTMQVPDRQICTDCHSTTGKNPVTGVDSDPNKRIPFAPSADGTTGVFTNHHPEGDEFRRSPHKALTDRSGNQTGCVLCHDPHKSVWHKKGGVKFVDNPLDDQQVGTMCAACHQNTNPDFPNAPKVRIRGAMGDIGLACVDCHMPEKSEGSAANGVATSPFGQRRTHLFKINATSLAAADNVTVVGSSKYWNSTDLNGDSFLTLDMVCTQCHDNMTRDQMANYAQGIHRQPGMVDLTVNNGDSLQVVNRDSVVSVDFSIQAGAEQGVKARWYVVCQTPKGWQSWNGKMWKAGFFPWRRNVPINDVPAQNVLHGRLPPGYYTYWVGIIGNDGSQNFDSVPVYVAGGRKPARRTKGKAKAK